MQKHPRHITLRVDHETADAFHACLAARGQTASGFLRAAIRAALAAPPTDTASSAPSLARAA